MAGADGARDHLGLEFAGAETLGRGTPRHDDLHTRQRAVALHVRGPTRQPAIHHVAGWRSRVPSQDARRAARTRGPNPTTQCGRGHCGSVRAAQRARSCRDGPARGRPAPGCPFRRSRRHTPARVAPERRQSADRARPRSAVPMWKGWPAHPGAPPAPVRAIRSAAPRVPPGTRICSAAWHQGHERFQQNDEWSLSDEKLYCG